MVTDLIVLVVDQGDVCRLTVAVPSGCNDLKAGHLLRRVLTQHNHSNTEGAFS
jgi:hypothetical protein